MRKPAIAAVAVIVLASGGVALANGDPTRTSDRTAPAHSITVTGKTTQLNLLDQGLALGDQIAFSDDLLTEPNAKAAGLDGGACTLIRVTDADACRGNRRLPQRPRRLQARVRPARLDITLKILP